MRLRAVEPVQYNRQRHAPGAVFAVDAHTAARLIEDGDAERVTDAGAGAPSALDGTDKAGAGRSDAANTDRQAALIAAMAQLEPGHRDHWTGAGKPEIRALSALTGLRDITAAERDAVWAAAEAAGQTPGAAETSNP